ncbi:hypothetical protein AT575_01875 [Streptococcus penaeicida]|uniref:Uncharacterized protein n=1 Tax=Streptococcus penaeicida TaxID=1765960 RepID=A0A2N8LDS7_9STRE|nr:hypothetical protein [Streptococcus penaeicida]PND48319.1 hypothetical protein AT575_01875 [Streptococcus penaeicida]
MKSFMTILKDHLIDFIESKPREKHGKISLNHNQLITKIKKAVSEQVPVHLIANQKSYTGLIVKYDKNEGQIIFNNSQNKLTSIITLKDIEKISPLPHTK